LNATYTDKPKIPKIIHYYWAGEDPVLDIYKNVYVKRCQELNPDYEFKFWGYRDAFRSLNLNRHVLKFLLSKEWRAQTKDFYMYKILLDHGGIFLDYDIICVKPFGELTHRYSFFTHLEPFSFWNYEPSTNVGVLAAAKNHTIMSTIYQDYQRFCLEKDFKAYILRNTNPLARWAESVHG